jgi:hypothetical protein
MRKRKAVAISGLTATGRSPIVEDSTLRQGAKQLEHRKKSAEAIAAIHACTVEDKNICVPLFDLAQKEMVGQTILGGLPSFQLLAFDLEAAT